MVKRLVVYAAILLLALFTTACQWCISGVLADGTCASVSGGPAPTTAPTTAPTSAP